MVPWVQHKNEPNVLFLTYESLKSDPKTAIIAVAHFLGSVYVKKIENLQILESILDHTSFTRMSKDQSRWSNQRPAHMTTFIRKGEVGDWKSHFSASQAQQLTQKFREKTTGTEAADLWSQEIVDLIF